MKTESIHSRLPFIVLAAFMWLLAASCSSGGGGGGDDDGGGGGQTLSEYDFAFSLLSEAPLTLDSSLGTATLEAIGGGASFGGVYSLEEDTVTMNFGWVKITTTLWDDPLSIGVNDPIVSMEGENPDQGSMTISSGEGLITVSIASSAGVNISLNGGASVYFTWDQFDELLGSGAPDWQQQASFAATMIGFVFSQLDFVVGAITLIAENDSILSSSSVIIDGATFPGTPPAGISAEGTLTLSNTEGEVGPGGSFSEVFDDFWVNDSMDDIDTLFEGRVDLVGYLEDVDENGITTAIGFIPDPGDPGGVFFDDGLTIYETEENPAGVFTIDDTSAITITGRYSIMFYEPGP
jgi:hypothetical protein